jgi:3-phenylpropionate/trans-cinnamate dioxygenase ferredoxin subunit
VGDVIVCKRGDVEPGSVRRFDVDGLRLAVVRIPSRQPEAPDDFYVIGDECSHEDYSLSEGDVWPDEREIECPKHGSMFSVITGEALTLPATKPIPTYDVRVDGDDVVVMLP